MTPDDSASDAFTAELPRRRRGKRTGLLRAVHVMAAGLFRAAEEMLGPQRRSMPGVSITREDDTELRARTLKRLEVDPGPLAFVDACDLHAAEVAFGEDALDDMSFAQITRREPGPVKRWRPGEPPPATEKAKPEDLVSIQRGTMNPGDDRWREIPDDDEGEASS